MSDPLYDIRNPNHGRRGGLLDHAPQAPEPIERPDPRIMYMCQCCEEHEPDGAVCCREGIAVMPDGTWLCDDCYSDCEKSAYGFLSEDGDDFEYPRFDDLPRPPLYAVKPPQSAASTVEPVAVPAGYALVPLIPTAAMIDVGRDNNPTQWGKGTDRGFAADVANDVYVSMVRAAIPPTTWPNSVVAENATTETSSPEITDSSPEPNHRVYVCYDGFGSHYVSKDPKQHVAICYDEDFADRIVEMCERRSPEPDAVREAVANTLMNNGKKIETVLAPHNIDRIAENVAALSRPARGG